MSRYGDADYDDMAYELDEFLEKHRPSELLKLVQDAVEWWEGKTMGRLINESDLLKSIEDYINGKKTLGQCIDDTPTAQPEPQWIPCSERLPENIRPVIVTWKNTDPASYYQYIVGKHFTGTACYKNGKWYWYSSTTEDMLAEYGRYDSEEFDEAIECIAWMPLPEPWRGEEP